MDEFAILLKLLSPMGEKEAGHLNREVPGNRPVSIGVYLPGRLRVSKANLVISNAPSIFPNSDDVVDRTEDDIKVDRPSLEEVVPFRRGEACRGDC